MINNINPDQCTKVYNCLNQGSIGNDEFHCHSFFVIYAQYRPLNEAVHTMVSYLNIDQWDDGDKWFFWRDNTFVSRRLTLSDASKNYFFLCQSNWMGTDNTGLSCPFSYRRLEDLNRLYFFVFIRFVFL